MQRIFPERCGRCSGGLPLWRVFLYRIAILFFPQVRVSLNPLLFRIASAHRTPPQRFLPFFDRPFCKKAATPRSSAATRPCRSHRVNDTPARSALPLCSALRLPVPALGFPPHFCPDTTTRPFPLHPAEPAPGAPPVPAPDAGGKTSRNFRCDPPPERVRGKQESSEDRLSPPPTWTVYGTPGIYNACPACFSLTQRFCRFSPGLFSKRTTARAHPRPPGRAAATVSTTPLRRRASSLLRIAPARFGAWLSSTFLP